MKKSKHEISCFMYGKYENKNVLPVPETGNACGSVKVESPERSSSFLLSTR